jgi:hypothetical protein
MCRCKARVTRHAEHILPKLRAALSLACDAARAAAGGGAAAAYEACANVVAAYEVIFDSPHVGKVTPPPPLMAHYVFLWSYLFPCVARLTFLISGVGRDCHILHLPHDHALPAACPASSPRRRRSPAQTRAVLPVRACPRSTAKHTTPIARHNTSTAPCCHRNLTACSFMDRLLSPPTRSCAHWQASA